LATASRQSNASARRDGFEVAEFVKQNPEFCQIPVLLLTGAFEPVDQDRVRAVGCDGILAKPFEPQLLIARVKELLAMPPGERRRPGSALAMPDVAFDEAPLQIPSTTPKHGGEGLDDLSLSAREAPESRASLDEYFDQLDVAFTSRGIAGEAPARPGATDWPSRPGDTAWGPSTPPVPPDLPSPGASAPGPAQSPATVITGVSPEIAAAFDWLLAAEQGQPVPPDAILAPGGPRSVAMDTVVDEVARRVVERLADRRVRDQVAEIVSNVAERLVRQEIERLKALK
jgi:hypothetical protein